MTQTPPSFEASGNTRSPEEIIDFAYSNFNARNIDAVLSVMDPDVDWPNGMEGGRVIGHDAVRDWTRQWKLVDPHVTPVSMAPAPNGRLVVHVHQKVSDLTGSVLFDHMVEHIYDLRDGLIQSMEIREVD